MTLTHCCGLLILLFGCSVFSLERANCDDNGHGSRIKSNMEGYDRAEHRASRDKRNVYDPTVEEVLKDLLNEVELLKKQVSLLEMDNANFQNTIATVMKITDKKLIKHSCGCMKSMLKADGVVPCEMTKVITMPSSTVEVVPTPSMPVLMSSAPPTEQVSPVRDSPVDMPIDPSIVAVSYYGYHFFRYRFGNGSFENMNLQRRVTYALTFDPVSERIIWTCYNPPAVYSSNVDGTNLTTLISEVISYGIAVDVNIGVIFLSTVSPRHSVSAMYIDGSGYRVISHVGKYGRPSRIALDTKNEVIYVCFRTRIVKVSYNGSQQTVFIRGSFMTSLTFDNTMGVLYYADRINIYRVMDTTDAKPKSDKIIRFKPKTGSYPCDMSVVGDNMYIGYKFKPSLDVLSVENRTVRTLGTLDGEFVSFCIIY
ncbi:uncharacterized protein [Haliotis asinina]|uniref:uncharacterized protein n=1 Tax=Haliotis asinina TaxID=109174 RepID=UPI003531F20F